MARLDPIELELFRHLMASISDEMGIVLKKTAFSVNIKERRDYSCAVYDARGETVAMGDHMPVHLGAMPEAVAAVMARDPRPGEVWALNDPYTGGTHLPDITLVSRTALGFAVSRAHHADVGGMEPASLPAGSTELFQEGLIIPPTRLDDDLLGLIAANSRNPDERRGDLRAQLAAHRLAEQRVAELVERRGSERVLAAMDALFAYSERRVRAGIAALPDGCYEAADVIEAVDRDLEIRVAVTVAGDAVDIDFDGTAAQYAGNLNCPLAVTQAACFFVVRLVTDPDIPASGGAFAPVSVRAPVGSLVNARFPAAVVAGNTETSSRITDVVMAAFRQMVDLPAAGQGTMNNTTFGTSTWTYYETIGGGQGASPAADGPSAVHVAMSNALNTPVEALELSYPLRVERYGLRLGAGGDGRHRGGDGVVREIRVLEACRLSVLGDRRRHAPPGAVGGGCGERGRTLVNGEEIPGKDTRQLAPGDVVRIETPGGGGFGAPEIPRVRDREV